MSRGYSGRTVVIAGVALVIAAILVAIGLQFVGLALGAILGAVGMIMVMLGVGRMRADRED